MTILIYLWPKSWIFRPDGLADGGIINVKDLPEIILKNFWDDSARIIFKNWGSFITVVHPCKMQRLAETSKADYQTRSSLKLKNHGKAPTE